LTRSRLPNRRPSRTIRVQWGNHRLHVTIGFCPTTAAPKELFFSDGMKSGSDLRHTVEDACVLVSLLLQRGATIEEIGKSMGTVDAMGQVSPASIIGAIVNALAAEVAR
jgi:hypothetical protein